MKSFNDFNNAFKWVNSIVKKANPIATEQIAKDVYKDSKEFTYLDTEEMYNSGASSDFKKGYVLIKAPQVRKLYYIKCNPRRNKNARIMWFEATKSKNMNNYKQVISTIINKLKGG
jgi:hypothetical protein